jgi:hypothetical protein
VSWTLFVCAVLCLLGVLGALFYRSVGVPSTSGQ